MINTPYEKQVAIFEELKEDFTDRLALLLDSEFGQDTQDLLDVKFLETGIIICDKVFVEYDQTVITPTFNIKPLSSFEDFKIINAVLSNKDEIKDFVKKYHITLETIKSFSNKSISEENPIIEEIKNEIQAGILEGDITDNVYEINENLFLKILSYGTSRQLHVTVGFFRDIQLEENPFRIDRINKDDLFERLTYLINHELDNTTLVD
ncbi:gp238 [Sphingomonas phage PAU]|uniref:gp238 n=1 Tax=Sphingomonas phage PAU TaxID=1150991 RepID=UPI000257338C|nr:gp238 [Sphingomonas phage PAU]AFF28236.1 gp238 [Sphingomonas phage PAU]